MIEFYKHRKQQSQFTWKRKATLKEMFPSLLNTDGLDFQLPQLIAQHTLLQYAPICHCPGSGNSKRDKLTWIIAKQGRPCIYIASANQKNAKNYPDPDENKQHTDIKQTSKEKKTRWK